MLFNIPRGNIVAWFARDGDASRLVGMLELAVTAALGDLMPAILFDQSDRLCDFHR